MSETAQTKIFGIDLGTTYSCIAHIEHGVATVIKNAQGDNTTPSVVQFAGQERIVGKEAKRNTVMYPDSTISLFKRWMGKPEFSDVFVFEGKSYTPEEMSSYVLRKLADDAELFTGQKVTDVVITCPAYFGIPEREATRRAGQIAGFNVRSIINEPTAAAIAYGVNEEDDQVILVYDLGGGTFDVTVIAITDGNIRVVCTDGDHELGGHDWDEAIISYLAGEWQSETGSGDDPLESFETLEDLRQKAEDAKKTLSQRDKTMIRVLHDGQTARVELTREKFDELTGHLLNRTRQLTEDALEEAKKRGYATIDKFLLVGGSTRMPQVPAMLEEAFSMEPQVHDPDEAVAKGAAIYGQKLLADEKIKIEIADALGVDVDAVPEEVEDSVRQSATEKVARDMQQPVATLQKTVEKKIENVTSRSFGIIVWDRDKQEEIVSNIIMRNEPLPAAEVKQYGTRDANQAIVEIRVVDNLDYMEETTISKSREIGKVDLDLPPGLPAGAPIQVSFELDEQGLLQVEAIEQSEGRTVDTSIRLEAGSSEEQLEEAASRSKDLIVS